MFLRAVFTLFVIPAMLGCSNFQPSFNQSNVLAAPVHGDRVPFAEIENTVKCEMGKFFADYFSRANDQIALKRNGEATVELEVLVSSKGGVQYTTIDLEDSLFESILIAAADGIAPPKFELSGTGSVTAKITFTIAQSAWSDPEEKCDDAALVNRFNPFSRDSLGIKAWLNGFFKSTYEHRIESGPETHLKEIKLESKFLLVASLNSSFHRFIRLIPLAKFPIGIFDQQVTNRISIAFQGKPKQTIPSPSVTECLIARASRQVLHDGCKKVLKDQNWPEKA